MTTRMYTEQDKSKLIEIALNESGTISGCYSMFHDFSGTNAWLLSIQQMDRGLDVTPVMCGSKWVKSGIISEETKKRLYRQNMQMFARVPQQVPIYEMDEETNKPKKDKDGKPIVKYFKTTFPFSRHFFSYSMFKKNEILKEYKVEVTIDFEETLKRLDLTMIKYNNIDGNCQGYCYPKNKTIAINPVAENPQKTLLHEIAHCLLHSNDERFVDTTQPNDRCVKEAEAEMVAYVCSVMLGETNEETLSHSRGYIQKWLSRNSDGKAAFTKENTARVMNAIDIVMKAVANYKGNYDKTKVNEDLKRVDKDNEG